MAAERDVVSESEQYLSSGNDTVLPPNYQRKETTLPGGGFEGLFTTRDLRAGYVVGVYIGDLIHVSEADRRKDYFTQDHRWNEVVYLFDVDLPNELIRDKWSSMFARSPFLREQYSRIGMPKTFVIDGYRNGSFVRYVNATFDDSRLNCQFMPHDEYVYLVVTRDIPSGSELLTTYGDDTDSIIYSNPGVPLTNAGESKMFDMMVSRTTGRVGALPWIKRIGSEEFDFTTANQFLVQMFRSTSTLGEEILIEPAEDPSSGFIMYKTDLIRKGFLVVERSGRYLNIRFKNLNDIFYDDSYSNGRYRMVLRIEGGQKPGVHERHFILASTEDEAATYIPGAAGNPRPVADGIDEEKLYEYRMSLDPGTAWAAESRVRSVAVITKKRKAEQEARNKESIHAALKIRNKAIAKLQKPRNKGKKRYGGLGDYRGDPFEDTMIPEVTMAQMPAHTYAMRPLPVGPGIAYRPRIGVPPPSELYTPEEYEQYRRQMLVHLSTDQQILDYHAERVRRAPVDQRDKYREGYEAIKIRMRDREAARPQVARRPHSRARRRPFARGGRRPMVYAPPPPVQREREPMPAAAGAVGPQAARFMQSDRRRRREASPPRRFVRRRVEIEPGDVMVAQGVGVETYEWRRENVSYADADKTEEYEMSVDGMALTTLMNGGRHTRKPLVDIEVLERLPGNLQFDTCTYYGIPVYSVSNTTDQPRFFVSIEDIMQAGLMTPADTYALFGTEEVPFRLVNEVVIDEGMLHAIEPDQERRYALMANMAPNLYGNSYTLRELQKALGRPIGADRFGELWEHGIFYAYVSVNFSSVQFGAV